MLFRVALYVNLTAFLGPARSYVPAMADGESLLASARMAARLCFLRKSATYFIQTSDETQAADVHPFQRKNPENIIVANQGSIFLAGPPLVKAALGEVVDSETLGGGAMHARESGVVDHLATSDEHAIALARQSVAAFAAASGHAATAEQSTLANGEVDEPVYDPKELGGVTGTNLKKSWDMREVIARTVDGSRFAEWKREWGDTVVTGFGELLVHRACRVGEPSAFEHAVRMALLTRLFLFCTRLTAEVHGHQVGIVSSTHGTLCVTAESKRSSEILY